MPDEKLEYQPPDVLAMVLADNVLRDAGGKHYIQGTYAAIFARGSLGSTRPSSPTWPSPAATATPRS